MSILLLLSVSFFGDSKLLSLLGLLVPFGFLLLCSGREERRIEIILNGEKAKIADALTVDRLVRDLELQQRQVAVEVNNQIISRASWTECRLKAGDRVEIVHFVGGGEEG